MPPKKASKALKRPAADDEMPTTKKLRQIQLQQLHRDFRRHSKTRFVVHEDLIREESTYFKNLSDEQWKDIKANGKTILDQNPHTFRLYLEWAHTQSNDLVEPAKLIGGGLSWRLCDLWVLADFLGDGTCKNVVMDMLIRETAAGNVLLDPFTVDDVYWGTQPGSKLRKRLVDTKLPTMQAEDVTSSWKEYPADMIKDMFRTLLEKKSSSAKIVQLEATDAYKYYD